MMKIWLICSSLFMACMFVTIAEGKKKDTKTCRFCQKKQGGSCVIDLEKQKTHQECWKNRTKTNTNDDVKGGVGTNVSNYRIEYLFLAQMLVIIGYLMHT